MRKAVSPLIAWVLIIGFSIAAGLFVTRWAINEFKDLNFGEDKEIYCEDVSFDLNEVCILPSPNNDEIRLDLSNKGLFAINRLYVGRTTTGYGKSWCNFLSLNLNPSSNTQVFFKAGSPNSDYSNTKENDCQNDLNGGKPFDDSNKLVEIEVVPWIKIDDRHIPCSEKGIVLNSIVQLNTICGV